MERIQESGAISNLIGNSEAQYGSEYRTHLLEQYKLYVEMADRISQRRQLANTFFLAVNSALVAVLGVAMPLTSDAVEPIWFAAIGVAGIILSVSWNRLVRSYRDLNAAKFRVILELEAFLPVQPYRSEWDDLGQGEDSSRYLPFTWIEAKVPWIFASLHVVLTVGSIFAASTS